MTDRPTPAGCDPAHADHVCPADLARAFNAWATVTAADTPPPKPKPWPPVRPAQRLARQDVADAMGVPAQAARPPALEWRWRRGKYAGRTLAGTPLAHLRRLAPRLRSRRWRDGVRQVIEYRTARGHVG